MEKLMIKTTLFLAMLFAFHASSAFAGDYAERYKEQKDYWDRVYNDIEKSYGEDQEVSFGFINLPPIAGSTVWAPAVWHIAILEDGLSESEQIEYVSKYKNTLFPLYCGYIIFGHDESFTFISKTDLPVQSVTNLMRYSEKSPPIKQFDYYNFHQFFFQNIALVQLFPGIYGMDFVPQFKHQYPYGQPPEGLDREELFQLENHVSFERERSNGPSQ